MIEPTNGAIELSVITMVAFVLILTLTALGLLVMYQQKRDCARLLESQLNSEEGDEDWNIFEELDEHGRLDFEKNEDGNKGRTP